MRDNIRFRSTDEERERELEQRNAMNAERDIRERLLRGFISEEEALEREYRALTDADEFERRFWGVG